MHDSQHARDLAKLLAPILEHARDFNAEPGPPDSPPRSEKVIEAARPGVDSAIRLELQDAWKKRHPLHDGGGNQPAGKLSDRLTEVLECDDHAVGVLWALLADCDDHLQAPAGTWGTDGRRASRGGQRSSRLPGKAAAGLGRVWANICMNALVALVLFLAWRLAWPPLQVRPQAGVLALEVFAIWSLSFLPGWLYIRFLGQRAGALWDEYVLNLHRLRWDSPRYLPKPPVNSDFYSEWLGDGGTLLVCQPNIYQQKFDAYYGKSVSRIGQREDPSVRIGSLFPVFLTTAALAVCWTAALWSPRFTSDPTSFWDVLKFGFLGAYSFVLQMLIRRFFQSDLRPAAYANALLRLIVVLILVPALYQIVPRNSPGSAAVIAFVIGFFPLAGMQAIQRFAATALRVVLPSLSPPYPLSQIDGMSVWYEARLLEEGIEDMQSLATANFVDVILHTRVPVGRLVDWVDQAHLYLHLDRLEGTWRERRQAKTGDAPGNEGSPLHPASLSDQQPLPADAIGAGSTQAGDTSQSIVKGSVTESSRAGSKTRTALRQLGIRKATDLINAFPPGCVDPGRNLAPGSPWGKHLTGITNGEFLDQYQLRTMVRVLYNEPSLAPVWNWQERGVRKYAQPVRCLPILPSQPAGVTAAPSTHGPAA